MKIQVTWIRVTAAAAMAAGVGVGSAGAQYAPYRPMPQRLAMQPAATTQQMLADAYQAAAVAAYPQTTSPYVPTATAYPSVAYPQAAAQYPAGYPTYPSVARQPDDVLPAPDAGDDGAVNGEQNGVQNGETNWENGKPANGGHNGHKNGQQNGHANGYPTVHDGDNGQYADYGLSGYFDNPGYDSQWFGGVYGLIMTRDDSEFRRLTAQFDTPAGGYPYYPTADETVLSTADVEHDYRGGAEIRFGSTFSTGGYDDCDSGYGHGGKSCDMQEYAWEVGYWILDDDENTAEVVDAIPTDTNRIYGMKNFAGLLYNGEPVNLWYDYQVPVQDPAGPPPWGSGTLVRVLAQRVRSNFQAQNLELNFFRLPLCGVATCGTGYGSYGGDDCETGQCAPACGSPFSVTTLCGVRYLRVDDDFEYATMWAIDDGTGTLTPPAYTPWDGAGELYYDIEVDNHLAGFQLGANMNYCVSCKCNVFWNSNFGLYNNHIESYQRVYGELGPATWVGSGADATIDADKDDVAFVGEMLVGTSYDFTYHWRGVIAYRAVAISGVALSVDQIPEDFSNEAQVALIDSNGSLIIHGVQVGAECRY